MVAPVGVGDILENDDGSDLELGEDGDPSLLLKEEQVFEGDPSLLPKEEQVFEDYVPGFEEDNAILRGKKGVSC